ncbi:hypothetical protein MRX96_019568 [Rhipicephalus microplus]
MHKHKVDGAAAAFQRRASHEKKTARTSASKGEQALVARQVSVYKEGQQTAGAQVKGILNSSESSGSSCAVDGATTSSLAFFWNEETSPLPDEPSPGSSSLMISGPESSGLSSRGSRMSLVGYTSPKDADQQYPNEGFLKSKSSWDEGSHPDSATPPFWTNNAPERSVSKSRSRRTTTSKMATSPAAHPEEKEIWASPSWSPARNSSAGGEKSSQTSRQDYCPQSSRYDHFRTSPLVKANLQELACIIIIIRHPNTWLPLHGAEGIDSGVQMATGDGDISPTKKSKN